MEIIPNWHPFVVHFSVALLVTATLLLSWGTIKGRLSQEDTLISAGRLILWLGLFAIVVTAAAGLQAYYSVDHDSPSHLAMTNHRNWAFGSLAAFLIVGLVMWDARKSDVSVLHVGALVISTGLLLSTAYKGGELVYKYGLGVQSLPVVIGEGHDHEHAEGEGHGDTPTQEKTEPHEPAEGAADDNDKTDNVIDSIEKSNEEGHAHPSAVLLDPALVADALHDALNAGDGEAVSKLLAEDVMILESGHAQKSKAEYMGGHMKSDMAFLPYVVSTIVDRKVSQAGNLAWVITHSRMKGNYKGQAIDSASREMLVMKHNGHDWQITLIHWGDK